MSVNERNQNEKGQSLKNQKDRRKPWHTHLTYFGLKVISPFRKLWEPSGKILEPYVKKGQVVADLGCGPGYFTLAMAEIVGPEGKVYAVDFDKSSIRDLQKKASKVGHGNVEAHASTAADLSFIKDKSVDFIFAYGLL